MQEFWLNSLENRQPLQFILPVLTLGKLHISPFFSNTFVWSSEFFLFAFVCLFSFICVFFVVVFFPLREGWFCLSYLLLDITPTVGTGRTFSVDLIKSQAHNTSYGSCRFNFLCDSSLH